MQLRLLRALFVILGSISAGLAARIAVAIFYSPRRFPSANWEKAGLALGVEGRMRFDGELLTTTIWGEGGPVVLLVHGWQGRRSQMVKIAVELARRGYRAIAFDGPAHGSSSKKSTSLVEFSQAVASAARQFGPLHAIVGHSFGAAAVAIAAQDGGDVRAENMVLISCPYSLRNVVGGFARYVGISSRIHERMYPIMARLHHCHESKLSFDSIGPGLKMRCLMIHDNADQYIPAEDGKRASGAIKNSQFVSTSGLGHMRILQDEAVVKRIVDYIDGLTAIHRRIGEDASCNVVASST